MFAPRPLCFALAFTLPALGGPAQDVASQLRERRLDPPEAALAWSEAGTSPQAALEALRELPLLEAPQKDHDVTLVDSQGRETAARIVLPPDGPAKDGRYRLLVLLHGLGGDYNQALKGAEGLVPPHTILAAPTALNPAGERFEDLRLTGALKLPVGDLLRVWFSYQPDSFPLLAMDYVVRRYPIDRDRVVLAGYSMGGFCAWNLGLRYPDRFAGLLPMAGGISREEYLQARDPLPRALLDNAAMVPCFFIHGGKDEVVPVKFDRWTAEDLTARGIEHTYREIPGGKHVLREFVDPLGGVKQELREWMAARVRDPHPKRVIHRTIGAYHPGSYWVRVDAHEGNAARVEATVVARNRIEVATRGVTRLTVYLDPTLVDARKPVTLVVDGEVAFQGRAEPSLETVASTYARLRDPGLTYTTAVSVDVKPREVEQLGGVLDGVFPGR